MAFKVQIPDGSWHSTEDLTGAELQSIEEVTGISWSLQNPFRNIESYRAIVGAFALRTGMETADLVEWFNAQTARDLAAGLKVLTDEEVENDFPETYEDGVPLAADAPTTGSSASSGNPPGAGPPT